MRLLLLDDDAATRACAISMIRELTDMHVQEVSSIQEALVQLSGPLYFPILFCDLQLEDGYGMDLIRHAKCREWLKYTTPIVMTVSAKPDTIKDCAMLGIRRFVVKPLHLNVVKNNLEPLIHQLQSERAEPIHETLRRLNISLETLRDYRQLMLEQLEQIQPHKPDLKLLEATYSGCLHLGMTRCANAIDRIIRTVKRPVENAHPIAEALADALMQLASQQIDHMDEHQESARERFMS